MASISHGPATVARETTNWASLLRYRELWATLAIAFMWLAVLFVGVYGHDFVSTNGSQTTTLPSVVFVALFALLGTVAVARHGFGRRGD